MFLSVLAILLQVPVGAPAGQPVRLTLEPSTMGPGEAVYAFVELATAGHLLVLHVTSDGRTDVVFPADPSEGTFVAAGSYEIRPGQRPAAFVAAQRAGGGVVLAALALVPYEFDEFLRGGVWDSAALASGAGADAIGRMLDIVQRMLGPEYFHYDVAPYTVAPYPAVQSDVIAEAYGGLAPWVFVPALPHPCFDLSGACDGVPPVCDGFTHRTRCREAPAPTAVARYRRGEPLVGSAGRAARPGPPAPASIGPRRREPGAVGPAPAAAGRPVSEARRVVPRTPRRATASPAPLPERVPWPRSVIAGGHKTPAPAISPREARLKQSTLRDPVQRPAPRAAGVAPRPPKDGVPAAASVRPVVAPRAAGTVAVAGLVRGSGVAGRASAAAPARAPAPRSPAGAPAAAAKAVPASAGARAEASAPAAPARGGVRTGVARSGKP